IKKLMLEKDAGVVIANRRFDESFCVVGGGGTDYLQSGRMDEVHFRVLRMERAAVNTAATWPTQNEGRRSTPSIVRFGDHVRDLVEGASDEVHKLGFGD